VGISRVGRFGLHQVRQNKKSKGLWALLALTSGASLLDVGCGHGRYAVAFRQRRAEITGLDLSAALLRRAQQVAGECGVHVNWVRGDMRQLVSSYSACSQISQVHHLTRQTQEQ
jgi:ubiquinone/menaquinone biosynthesis C-methylase UbiE